MFELCESVKIMKMEVTEKIFFFKSPEIWIAWYIYLFSLFI